MKKKIILGAGVLSLLMLSPQLSFAQRIQQPLGRGVVAVNNGSSVFVSWRKLAQEPEGLQYNIYKRSIGGGEYTLLISSPLSVIIFVRTTGQLALH